MANATSPIMSPACVHRLVRQHGLACDGAGGKDVRHVGAHLDVDVDETTVGDRNTGFVG